jgi:MoaA/NifB/PqqE/SkfB family radical SAM enzyme
MRNIRRIKNKIRDEGFRSLLRSAKINFFFWLEKQILFHFPRLLPLCFRKPRMLYLELSSMCNLGCLTCYRGKRKQGKMDLRLATHLIVQAAKVGGMNLHLGFAGEPLTYCHLDEVLAVVKKYRKHFYKVSLTTNGTLLTDAYATMLLDSGVFSWITVSMDAIGKRFEQLRVGASYVVVKKNLLNLIEGRNVYKEIFEMKNLPIISINCVLSSQTEEEIQALKKEWVGVVDNVNFSGCIDSHFKYLNMDKFKKINPSAAKKHLIPTCIFPFVNIVVLWDGSITFCCHNLNGEYSFGDAWGLPLSEIWNLYDFKRARSFLVANSVPKYSICYYCQKFEWMQ